MKPQVSLHLHGSVPQHHELLVRPRYPASKAQAGWDARVNRGLSLTAQLVKHLPAMQETRVRFLGLEKETATHSSIPAWRIPCTEEPGGLQSTVHRVARVGQDSVAKPPPPAELRTPRQREEGDGPQTQSALHSPPHASSMSVPQQPHFDLPGKQLPRL